MLREEPSERPDAATAINHDFFKAFIQAQDKLDQGGEVEEFWTRVDNSVLANIGKVDK